MGCRFSSPEKVLVRPPRRRLTIADTDGDEADGDASKAVATENLAVKLEKSDMLFMREQVEREGAMLRRDSSRWSFASETDADLHRRPSRQTKTSCLRSRGIQLNVEDMATLGVGVACTKGLKPEAPNQDSFVVVCFENELRIYGVFDGHGKQGHFVSNYVKEQLPKYVLAAENVMTDPEAVLSAAFMQMQAGLEQCAAREVFDCRRSGTTATIILHFVADNRVVVAHVGDSRAVISSPSADASKVSVKELTEDHRPDLPAERKRIESGGGTVRFDGAFNHRVYARDSRIHGPGLNMSRAFGDLVAHDHAGVSAPPDVSTWTVGENDKYLILSSDGIWEFITSQQACEIAEQAQGCMDAAVTLADLAWSKWRNFDPYTVDDITAVVIDLRIAVELAPKNAPAAAPGPVDLVEDIEPVNTVVVENGDSPAPELGVVDATQAEVPLKSQRTAVDP